MGEELYFLYFDGQYQKLLEQAHDDPFWQGMAFIGLGRYGEVEEQIEAISDEIPKKYLKSRVLYLIGEREKSLELSKELLQDEIVDYLRADLYRQCGNLYLRQSQLDQSIIYETKAIELFDRLGLYATKSACVNNLGIMYGSKGDYNSAIDCYTQSLDYSKKNISKSPDYYNKSIIIFSLNIIAAKFELKQYKESLNDLEGVVQMAKDYWLKDKEDQNSLHLYAVCLSVIISSLIELNQVLRAQQYLKILQSLPQEYYRVRFTVLLSTATMLLESHRLRDHYRAEEILQNLIQDPQIDAQELYLHRRMLFKVLLNEFELTGEQEVLDEILYHLENQLEIAIIENIPSLRLEVLLIRARIYVINSKLENALFLIDQVIDEASFLGITRIIEEAIADKEYVESEIENLIGGAQKYHSLSDTMHTKKLQDYIKLVREQLRP